MDIHRNEAAQEMLREASLDATISWMNKQWQTMLTHTTLRWYKSIQDTKYKTYFSWWDVMAQRDFRPVRQRLSEDYHLREHDQWDRILLKLQDWANYCELSDWDRYEYYRDNLPTKEIFDSLPEEATRMFWPVRPPKIYDKETFDARDKILEEYSYQEEPQGDSIDEWDNVIFAWNDALSRAEWQVTTVRENWLEWYKQISAILEPWSTFREKCEASILEQKERAWEEVRQEIKRNAKREKRRRARQRAKAKVAQLTSLAELLSGVQLEVIPNKRRSHKQRGQKNQGTQTESTLMVQSAPLELTPSPEMLASYRKPKKPCPQPKSARRMLKKHAKKIAKKLKQCQQEKFAYAQSVEFDDLFAASNDHDGTQLFDDAFEDAADYAVHFDDPTPSRVEGFQVLQEFVTGLAHQFQRGTESATDFATRHISSIMNTVRSFCETLKNMWNFAQRTHDFIRNTIGYKDFFVIIGFFLIYCLLAVTPLEVLGRAIFVVGVGFLVENKYIAEIVKFLGTVSLTWTVAKATSNININMQQNVTREQDVPRVQGPVHHPFMSIAFVVVALMCGMSTFTFDESKYMSFVKRIDAHAKLVNGATRLSECIGSLFHEILTKFGMEFCGFGANKFIPDDVLDIIKRLKAFDVNKRNAMAQSLELCEEAQQINDDFVDARIKYNRNREIAPVLDRLQSAVVNLYAQAVSYFGSSLKNRIEPVVMMLTGPPGVGKSSILYHIGAVVLAHEKKIKKGMKPGEIRDEIQKSLYARMHEQEYWDRYKNQPVTLIDDFGQVKDSVSNPNVEYMELIRISNPFPCPLHVAALDEKKSASFTSKCVVATTNLKCISPSSVYSKEAVIRRIDMPYEVRLKKECADNLGRLLPQYKTGAIDLSVYEFHPWDPDSGEVASDWISFEELTTRLIQKLAEKKEKFYRQQEGLTDFAFQMIDKVEQMSTEQQESLANVAMQFASDDIQETEEPRVQSSYSYEELKQRLQEVLNRDEDEIFLDAEEALQVQGVLDWFWPSTQPTVDAGTLGAQMQREHDRFREICHVLEQRRQTQIFTNPERCRHDVVWENLRSGYDVDKSVIEFEKFLRDSDVMIQDVTKAFEIEPSVFEWLKQQRERYSVVEKVFGILSLFMIGLAAYKLVQSFMTPKEPQVVESDRSRKFNARTRVEGDGQGAKSNHSRRRAEQWRANQLVESDKSRHNKARLRFEMQKPQILDAQAGAMTLYKSRMRLEGYGYQHVTLPALREGDVWKPDPLDSKRIRWNNFLTEAYENADQFDLDDVQACLYVKEVLPPWEMFKGMSEEEITSKINTKQPPSVTRAQAWVSDNAFDVSKLVKRNLAKIVCYSKGKILHDDPIRIFFLYGTTFLINLHYIHLLRCKAGKYDDFKLRICPSFSDEGVEFEWEELEKLVKPYHRAGEYSDLCAITLGKKNCGRFKDLRCHVIEKSQLVNLVGTRIVSIMADPNTKTYETKFGIVEDLSLRETINTDGTKFTCQGAQTNIGSVFGDCGAVYIMDSKYDARRICGIHYAGMPGHGCFIPLVYEDLQEICVEPEQKEPSYTVSDSMPEAITQGNCLALGEVLDPPHSNTKTKIHQTEVFDQIWKSEMAPAQLKHAEAEDGPMFRGIQKQFKSVPVLSEEPLRKAVFSYKKRLATLRCAYDQMRVLSFEEAVRGREGSEFIKGINRTTSPGYPYIHQKSKGKTLWFGKQEWDLEGPKAKEIREIVENQIKEMEQGIIQPYVFMDTLKDETLPLHKVEIGKTRVFAAAPMDFIIAFRMYFLSFLAFLMENRIESESAVGIRSQSWEWHKLADHLQKFAGDRHVAGDFSNYDGTLHPDILWAVLDVIEDYYKGSRYYKEEDQNVRRCLWQSIVNSYHVCGRYLYQLNHSQPSGNPATAILNSMYNSIACRVTYYMLAKDAESMEEFNDNVSMIAYGDDNLLNVSHRVAGWFNQQTMTLAFARFGMVYTDEEKTGNVTDFKPLSECYFLKRGFVFDSNVPMWFGPLKLPSILECFNWIHGHHNERDVIRQNAEAAFAELALHDRKTFDHYVTRIRSVVGAAYQLSLVNRDYDEYRLLVRNGTLTKVIPELNWA